MEKIIYKIEKRTDQVVIVSDIFINKLGWHVILSFPKNDEIYQHSLGHCYDDFLYGGSTIITEPT